MPYCRNCHKEISKFDADICPYCGQENPIDSSYMTMDVTQHLSPEAKGYKLYRAKSKSKIVLLCCFLGYFGLHEFYLGYVKKGLLEIFITLILVAGVGSALYFTKLFVSPLAFVFPFLAVWLAYAIYGLVLLKKENLKDANGEFIH